MARARCRSSFLTLVCRYDLAFYRLRGKILLHKKVCKNKTFAEARAALQAWLGVVLAFGEELPYHFDLVSLATHRSSTRAPV